MKEYLNSFEEVIKENNTSKNGLSSEEAKARLKKTAKINWKRAKRKAFCIALLCSLPIL